MIAKNWRTDFELVIINSLGNSHAIAKPDLVGISFGTAGLRARMEAGFSRMNCLTVIQTSQGLARYMLESNDNARSMGVVIGYDERHRSELFAQHTAAVFEAKGFKVYWYERSVHTPLVPFAVQTLGACVGIMITASHNPAADNGYKVYGRNGCQINAPVDASIAAAILKNLEPVTWDVIDWENPSIVKPLYPSSLHHECGLEHFYYRTLMYMIDQKEKYRPLSRFVYTPLHGVGLHFMSGALKEFIDQSLKHNTEQIIPRQVPHHDDQHDVDCPPHKNLNDIITVVDEQSLPNPNFPTVTYPNPEEKGALDRAMTTADRHNISLILANDPDADRLAVAEKVSGSWYQLTGDQVGVLLGYYIFEKRSDKRKHIMLTSVVSSQMLGEIGRKEGFVVEECLTGFKWLGNRAHQLGVEACSFGYEEALGYMIPNVCFDKDGVAAALLFLQMCSNWGSPWEKLQSLYKKYGYFVTMNTYWRSPNPATTASLFAKIRNLQGDRSVHPDLLGAHTVLRWRDLKAGFDSGCPGYISDLPTSGNTEMITFWLGRSGHLHSIRFTVRASGTEPKIKGTCQVSSPIWPAY